MKGKFKKIVRRGIASILNVAIVASMFAGVVPTASALNVPSTETVKVYESNGTTVTAEGKKFLDLAALYARTYSQAVKTTVGKGTEDWAENDDPKARSMYHGENAGDCTAYVSRALAYAGAVMDDSWYYYSPSDRAYAWGSVPGFRDYLKGGKGSFTVKEFSHTEVSDSSLRRGDIISTYNTSTGATPHTMIVCADIPNDGKVVIASSNNDRQYNGKAGINWTLTGEWGSNAYKVYRIMSYKRAAGGAVDMVKDGRANYGYGANGQMAYAVDTSVHPYLKDQGASNAPITVPKLMSKDGSTLYYCMEYSKMHPVVTSYVSSGSKVTDSNVAFVLANGWSDDKESVSDFNARINSLKGASGAAVQCPYEGYYATQLAIWLLQGNTQIALLTADKLIDNRSPIGTQNLDPVASQRVWNTAQALVKAAQNKGNWSSENSTPMTADINHASGWDKKVQSIGGTQYITVGPYSVSANKDFLYAKIQTNDINAKVVTSLTQQAIANAKNSADIDKGQHFYVVIPVSSGLNKFTVQATAFSTVRHVNGDIWMYQSSDHATSQQKVAGQKPGAYQESAKDSETVELFGWIKVYKTNEYNKPLESVEYGIYSDKACTKLVTTLKTSADGTAVSVGLTPGTYWVKETKVDDVYVLDTTPYEVTVVAGQTAQKNFVNDYKRGEVKVQKTSEDGLVEGIKFRLYGIAANGLTVDEVAITDANGVATFKDVFITDAAHPYTLEEVDTADKYVIPPEQDVTVEWNKVTNRDVENKLKKWNLTVTKVNAETGGEAEGDATLEGAVYGIFKDGEPAETVDGKVVEYTTNSKGQFTTDYYYCGEGYELREIKPSTGFKLDTSSQDIGSEPGLYTAEFNAAPELTSHEQPIKGMVKIIKHCDDGETGIDTPEVGAEFQIYLKSAGSFENAKESERDVLVVDEQGNAISQTTGEFGTKWLPYGTYTIHQTKGWEDKEKQPDFDVFLSKDGQVEQFILNDATISRLIKIVKEDAESGLQIPLAGFTFKVKNVETGEFVVQHINYPTPIDIDEFTTNEEGWLMLPEELPYGTYQLIETKAVPPYTLNKTPVEFKVDDSVSKDEPIVVRMQDMPQKGIIEISKTGILFDKVETSTSTIERTSIYDVIKQTGDKEVITLEKNTPKYGVHEISGTEFDIIAAEDIVTPDGVVHAKKGEVVDHLTTNASGKAESKELYLGKYIVKETKATPGQINSGESHDVALVYAGQDVAITSTATAFENVRQKVVVNMKKFMEINEELGLSLDTAYQNVYFGIYAAEDINLEYSENGDYTGLKKDTLVDFKQINPDGTLTFDAELPIGEYYVKEIATDEHYVTDDTKYPVSFQYQGEDVETVVIEVNNGEAIVNNLAYGNIEGIKKDEFGKLQEGSVFGLFKWGETEFTEETALMTATSDENGVFRFEHVVAGPYYIREIAAADGYLVNEEIFAAAVYENETTQITKLNGDACEGTIVNEVIRGNVATIKVDADYPDNKLSGAEWEVYVDVNHNGIYDADIDVLVSEENQGKLDNYTLVEREPGVYVLEGLVYGDYLLKETKAPDGFFLDENYYAFSIREDGTTVFVENKAGVGFINEAMEGQLILIKKDAATGDVLEGVELGVFDMDGNLVASGITDKDGVLIFAGLRIGKYYYQEIKALDGYDLDPTKHEFEIIEDNQVIQADVYNVKTPENPHTGDTTPIIPLAVTMTTAAVAAGALALSKKKKKDDSEDK